MPEAAWIRENLQSIVDQARSASPFIRLLILALVALCVMRGKVVTSLLAGLVGAVCITAAVMSVAFEDQANVFIFLVFFVLGLLWGVQALSLPGAVRPRPRQVVPACAFGLAAFFYPHFVEGVNGAVLFAPVGIVPCPTLILASAAVMAAGRALSLRVAASTWAAGALFGGLGVFYLGVKVDWILIAAVPVSAVVYFASTGPVKAGGGRRRRPR